MATTVSQIKTGLKTQLATISGLNAKDYQPDNVSPPYAWPMLDGITYHGAMGGGLVTYEFTVSVVVSRVVEKDAQTKLDNYLSWDGTTSVRAAIEADKTLGGVASNLIVKSAGNISTIDIGDVSYFAVDFAVTVYV